MFLGLRTVIYPAPDLAAAKAWFAALLDQEPYFDQPFYVGFNVGGYELGLDPNADVAVGPVAYWGVVNADEALRPRCSPAEPPSRARCRTSATGSAWRPFATRVATFSGSSRTRTSSSPERSRIAEPRCSHAKDSSRRQEEAEELLAFAAGDPALLDAFGSTPPHRRATGLDHRDRRRSATSPSTSIPTSTSLDGSANRWRAERWSGCPPTGPPSTCARDPVRSQRSFERIVRAHALWRPTSMHERSRALPPTVSTCTSATSSARCLLTLTGQVDVVVGVVPYVPTPELPAAAAGYVHLRAPARPTTAAPTAPTSSGVSSARVRGSCATEVRCSSSSAATRRDS